MSTTIRDRAFIGRTDPSGALRRFFTALSALFARTDQEVPLSAAELHAMADQYEATQPGFAADLRAAAERQQ